MSRYLLVVFSASTLFAQVSLELEGRYWFPQVSSTLRVERNGIGTDINGKNDLGFGDSNFPSGRIALHSGHHRLSFDYTPINYSGDQTVSRTVDFNGRTYTFGTRIVSDLEVHHLQLGWAYHFNLMEGLVKFGPLVEAHGFLMSGRLRAPQLSVDSNTDLSVGLPTVGPSLEISPYRQLDIYGEASGMTAGDYGRFVRAEAGLRIRPIRYVQLTAGYRTFNLRAAASSDFVRLYLRGPFVGAGFHW